MKTAKQEIHAMLTEYTGVAMCDSGDAYGRNWQRNKGKTLADFEAEPEASYSTDKDGLVDGYTISLYHYLAQQLELDAICREFNHANCKANDWDDDRFYGVSLAGGKILDYYRAEYQGESFNSCNGEDFLSQVIQGRYLHIAGNDYVILQIHGGCDVRGGYTTARLFRLDSANEYDKDFWYLAPQEVYGVFTPHGADLQTPALPGCTDVDIAVCSAGVIRFDNGYDGCNFTDGDGKPVVLNTNKGTVTLWLAEI